MRVKDATKLLIDAFKRHKKEKEHAKWCLQFGHLVRRGKNDFVTFEQYYNDDPKANKQYANKTKNEIMDDVELIQHSMRGGKRGI